MSESDCSALFRFHEGIKELLRPGNREGGFFCPVSRRASVKDVIESLGVPHTEVGRITLDGLEKDFSYLPAEGDILDVYAIKPPLDVTSACLLRPRPLQKISFVVDVNVGKLARLLRLLGLDAAYDYLWRDTKIAHVAASQGRVALSRDRSLLKRKKVEFGRLIRAGHPQDQLLEVLSFFGIKGPFKTFSRCLHCNLELAPVDKAEILHRLEPLTKKYFHVFHICPGCGRIYWPGSHHEKMLDWLEGVGLGAEEFT
ncbi:MAG: Mut7-C RNAse domain-containing protein [Thermodesulfobacteriota bacterium]|nr:Mut7-C RNAse domain-containing protein [Thermodesulfobacteriota bacterium]